MEVDIMDRELIDDILEISSNGDLAEIKEFINKNPEFVHARDEVGRTPLRKASYKGHTEVVKFLISKGADVKEADKYGRTPLHRASAGGQVEVAKLLINNGADINAKDKDGKTPLHEAVSKCYKNVTKLLISKGAEVNAKDEYGMTPLIEAINEECQEVIELLKNAGADDKEPILNTLSTLRGNQDSLLVLVIVSLVVSIVVLIPTVIICNLYVDSGLSIGRICLFGIGFFLIALQLFSKSRSSGDRCYLVKMQRDEDDENV